MLLKKYGLVMSLALLVLMLPACARDKSASTEIQSNLTVTVKETLEPGTLNPEDLFVAHFINVGDGDAILLVQGGHAMLVDGGPVPMGINVLAYLQEQGIKELDYMAATHPYADHIGGLPDVLGSMKVINVLLPMVYHDTTEYNAFLLAAEESGAKVDVPFAGSTFKLGEADITVLAPNPTDEWENKANHSIVMRVVFGTTCFMLTGDAMREVEANLLDSTADLSADVLKVARHGSASAATSGFLDAVYPSIAVISTDGKDSFLSQEVLRRLDNTGAHVFRTDINGNIILTSDGTTLAVEVERQ